MQRRMTILSLAWLVAGLPAAVQAAGTLHCQIDDEHLHLDVKIPYKKNILDPGAAVEGTMEIRDPRFRGSYPRLRPDSGAVTAFGKTRQNVSVELEFEPAVRRRKLPTHLEVTAARSKGGYEGSYRLTIGPGIIPEMGQDKTLTYEGRVTCR